MTTPFPHPLVLDPLLTQWLQEDWGRGDRATQALFGQDLPLAQGIFLLKEPGVIAGLPLIERVFHLIDQRVKCRLEVQEGMVCPVRTVVAVVEGPAQALLMGERVTLNLLQHLSGVATMTHRYVERLAGTQTRLVDTRKTTPGLRILEKYAVTVGGGLNHRFGLDDAAMIKDNHILAAGSITEAVKQVRAQIPFLAPIEVETETLEQVEEALACNVQVIMLDNMTATLMEAAVKLIAGKALVEASGGITLETLATVAATGVDYISTSATITRAPWLDISLDFKTAVP
jgi:nicotinate-nucleotide pyrophosphorylase (carboxylating)